MTTVLFYMEVIVLRINNYSWTCGKPTAILLWWRFVSFPPSFPPPEWEGVYEYNPNINTLLSPTGHFHNFHYRPGKAS